MSSDRATAAVPVQSEPKRMPPDKPSADYNVKILGSPSRFLRETKGEEVFRKVCDDAKLDWALFDGKTHWMSWEQFETFLSGMRAHVETDQEFFEACAYKIAEGYGPLRFLFWAATRSLYYRTAEKAGKFFSTVGKFELVASGATFARLKWTSSRQESRLMCLSRQAQSMRSP